MSDRYVEKKFLYLLVLSVLLHLAVYQLFALIPPDKPKAAQETTIVDLTDIPTLAPEPPKVVSPEAPEKKQQEVKRYAEKRQRFAREMAPEGEHELARPRHVPSLPAPARPQAPATVRPQGPPSTAPQAANPAPRKGEQGAVREHGGAEPVTRGEGIFKPKNAEGIGRAKLFPTAQRLASIEESYRKKYGPEVEAGEAMFLNTDDIRFGSFLRRWENAVYGVWHYPYEAGIRGIEGTTPVLITFDRKGAMTSFVLLQSSGSSILDDEVLRTLKQVGPVGPFPKGYTRETYKLIVFFHYAINGSRLR